MEVQGFSCHGCGSTDIEFDARTRKIHCNQCGREEYYSRAQLGATGKVAFAKDNAMRFFKSGDFASARQFAKDVLNTMQDNAAALYMVSYLREFYDGEAGAMRAFFADIQPVPLEYDEVRDLIGLFEATLRNMRDFEVEMITLMISNMQSKSDRKELETFIEMVCPTCISHYASTDFLTPERVDFYADIAANCNVPKTCFALIKAIKENPDSPWKSNTFGMKQRTTYFLEHFVEPVGRIVTSMCPGPYKAKLMQAYQQLEDEYRKRAAE